MSAILPFSEWLGVARSAGNRHRVVVLLQAYFDESGTSGDEPLTVIGGLVATSQTWLDFDALWRTALRHELKELSLDWFHMIDCERGENGFAPWLSKPELRRFAAKTMAEAIIRAGLTGFWVCVDSDGWKMNTNAAFKALYPKPYYFCFADCLRQIKAWVDAFAAGEQVDVIFAEQNEYQGRAECIYNAYISGKAAAPLMSLRFAPMPACAPLQAADLVVYSTNKSISAAIYNRDTKDRIYQSALDELNANPASFTGRHYGELYFMTVEDVPLPWDGQSS